MKIGIDARFYGPLGKGLGRYTQRLISQLEKIDHTNKYVIFLRRNNWNEYHPSNPNFTKVLADYRWYTLREQVFFPWKIWLQKIDLMHFHHFNVPIFVFCKFMVTVHDLILLQFPTKRATTLGPIKYKIKEMAYRIVIWLAVIRAQKVLTVSEYTKKQLIKYFKIRSDKVEVTYEAGDCPVLTKEGVFSLKQHKITKPYFLYVGNAYPHKNIEGLLKGFKHYIDLYGNDFQLVLVGKNDYFYQRLKKLACELGLMEAESPKVIFLGYVAQEKLPWVYRKAFIYVFPSFFEGFGLPPLEAMNHGLPVLSSNSTCLPEILGEAAWYFNPQDTNEMIEALKKVAEDQDLRQKLIQKGYRQTAKYSWRKCARKTHFVYKSLFLKEIK